jgi:uncharacterized protein
VASRSAIDAKLSELESTARRDGYAIGVASAYPVSIARTAEWALVAESRGIHLVPVSALAKIPGTEIVTGAR